MYKYNTNIIIFITHTHAESVGAPWNTPPLKDAFTYAPNMFNLLKFNLSVFPPFLSKILTKSINRELGLLSCVDGMRRADHRLMLYFRELLVSHDST